MDINHPSPLFRVQELLKKAKIDWLLVRSTDRFFNEYVPEYASARAYLTGFKGSVGDAIIGVKGAHLFVDGRYALQAKKEAPKFSVDVCDSHSSIEQRWLWFVGEQLGLGQSLAYDPETLSVELYDRLLKICEPKGIKLLACGTSIIEEAMKGRSLTKKDTPQVSKVPDSIAGVNVCSKLSKLKEALMRYEVDGFLAVKLDDIAWTFNLRSDFLPFQSTVPALACILKDGAVLSPIFDLRLPDVEKEVEIVKEGEFYKRLLKQDLMTIGIDEHETSKAHEMALLSLGFSIKKIRNPIAPLKAIKNAQELLNLRRSFRKADQVVHQTLNFIIQSYEKGEPLSEGDIDD
ncbi:MAG TPA: aminopeptidase P family N-terminal domain-containing protein, partial [Myxococcota bacterium]|nr:aminopeptidase P family N-terminal domain-containing protein [Myxococcota bacterium]